MVLSPRRKFISVVMLTCWSVLLTALTGVFGSVPLRGLRQLAGSTPYWLIGLSVAALLGVGGWWVLGLLLLSMVTVIGLFSEFEERGHTLAGSGFGAVVITTLMLGGAFAFWVAQQGASWSSKLLTKLEAYVNTIPGWIENVKVEPKEILLQMPSVIVVILILGLFLSLLMQRRVLLMVGLRSRALHRLTRFKVPEAFIWVLIAGIAGAFLTAKNGTLAILGTNLLNVAVVVFYLQGLAVVASYFETFRVGWFWQMLLFVLFATQLFILVSVIGLMDYWMDFRARLAKRANEMEREIFKK